MGLPTTQVTGATTTIPGLLVFTVTQVADERGYFQEKFQKEKLVAAGLPSDFAVVQNNISFNKQNGTARGLHAEPWDKYISVINGRAFCAWVDLRKGDSFGAVFYRELDPETTVFIPKGVANGYQTLETGVVYSYLVDSHWSADGNYQSVNLFDPELQIPWPIGKEQSVISKKDLASPMITDVTPMEF